MNLTQYLAEALDYLKIAHPKKFIIIQGILLLSVFFIEFQTDFGFILPPVFDNAKLLIIALGYGLSSSTFPHLPTSHKKVVAAFGESNRDTEKF